MLALHLVLIQNKRKMILKSTDSTLNIKVKTKDYTKKKKSKFFNIKKRSI